MRSLLGRAATITLAAGLAAGGSAVVDASPPDTTTAPPTTTTVAPTTTDAPTTTAAPTTTTTAPPTTTTTTTTTSPPLVVELPAPPARVTPSRGSQIQVTPTDPPPPTTTTTTVPSWLRLPEKSGWGRRVVYDKNRMRVWTVEADGTVSKTHLVSGRLTWNQPRAGTYYVFSRSRYTCNIKNPNICWGYMVRFAKGPGGDNIGFHQIPWDTRTGRRLQSVSQLGQALSGGCVRQRTSDAQYMWGWAPIGTKVVVVQ